MNTLYSELMQLSTDSATPFYHTDQCKHDSIYRIFSYHFTDKDSWLLPSALESRGIMFEVDRSGEPLRLASRPMQKFFNKGEVDFIDYAKPETVMDKADGSLISSYTDAGGMLWLKSKASLYSDHAVAAMEYLDLPENAELKAHVYNLEDAGYTVNMEWCSPDPKFRIVMYYPKAQLIILNARHRETGEYLSYDELMEEYRVRVFPGSTVENLETEVNTEGYVVIDANNNWYKLKTPWYLERHRAKDFINQPMAFVELVLKEEADDVMGLVADQVDLLHEMQDFQHKIVNKANEIVNTVTKYYTRNNALSRKDYAIKGQEELKGFEFPLAMQYYTKGEEPNWTGFLLNVHKKIDWGFQ